MQRRMTARRWLVLVLFGIYLGVGAAWVINPRGGWMTWWAIHIGGVLFGLLMQQTFFSRE